MMDGIRMVIGGELEGASAAGFVSMLEEMGVPSPFAPAAHEDQDAVCVLDIPTDAAAMDLAARFASMGLNSLVLSPLGDGMFHAVSHSPDGVVGSMPADRDGRPLHDASLFASALAIEDHDGRVSALSLIAASAERIFSVPPFSRRSIPSFTA
jgi:hypothetical protein